MTPNDPKYNEAQIIIHWKVCWNFDFTYSFNWNFNFAYDVHEHERRCSPAVFGNVIGDNR